MTIAQYLSVLRRQWFVVLLLVAVCVGGAAAWTSRQVPTYAATTQLFVSVQTPQAPDIAQMSEGSAFVQQRVTSYADIVTSPKVLDGVIQRLRLPMSAQALAGQVTVHSPLDTVLLDITVTDSVPARAADVANAIAAQFPAFVSAIETPPGAERAPVTVSPTQLASVPKDPIAPRVPLNIALGLLVGLGLGVGLAVLRDGLDTAIGGAADVERLTGAVPLGVVPFDAGTAKQPLVDADTGGPRAEAFRTLRTNLQFADVDRPPRVVVVTSPLPSEGKSTTAGNLALTLALGGARVVLVDGDLRRPTVGRYLGVSNAAGLTSVLAGQHELRDVVVAHGRTTLSVLPSGPTPPNPSELLGSQQMADLLTRLAAEHDVVLIDAPPLLPVTDAAVLAAVADGAVLVVRHGRTRCEELERAVQSLGAVNARLLGCVLNFAPRPSRRGGYDGYGYGPDRVVALPDTAPAPTRAPAPVPQPVP